MAALSRALRLDEDESALLHRAAGLAPATGSVTRVVPEGVERMVTRLREWPVAVYSADWWLLRWNPAWTALLGDSTALQGRARNVVWYEMTQPSPRVWIDPREDDSFRDAIVGDLRSTLIEHLVVGLVVLDGDVLQVPGHDLRIVVYSPAPGTQDAERLAQLTTAEAHHQAR